MKRITCMTSLFFIVAIATARPQVAPNVDDARRRAEMIKPSPEELKWQRIPWLTDLTKGIETARQERRPILLWVTGDDPLERC